MSAGAQIDYGAHSAAAPPIDYGDHAPVEKPLGEQPATLGGVASTMSSQAGRFLGAAFENLNPANLLKAGLHPIDTAHAAFGATVDALDRFDAARKKGNWTEAANSMVGAIPLLGPAGEQIVKEIEDGKHAEALGHAAGLRLVLEAPSAIAKAGETATLIKNVATDPAVVRAGVKVLPKGPAMVSAYDTIKGAIDRAKGVESPAPVEPSIPEGIDPDLWAKLTPEMQERLRTGQTAAPRSTPAPHPARDPSYYGIEPKPAIVDISPQVQTIPFEPAREAAGAAKAAAPRTAVAQKIGDNLVRAGVTDDLLEQIAKSPQAEATFRQKVGSLHAEDYTPSDKTWAQIREIVKAAKPKTPETVTVSEEMPAYLKKNPKAAQAAISLADLMNGVK